MNGDVGRVMHDDISKRSDGGRWSLAEVIMVHVIHSYTARENEK